MRISYWSSYVCSSDLAAIMKSVQTLIGLKDDQGEPMNEDASSFLVMVPVSFMGAAAAALKNPVIVDGSGARTTLLTHIGGFQFELDRKSAVEGKSGSVCVDSGGLSHLKKKK